MSKVAVIYNSGNAESILAGTLARTKKRHETVQVINIVAMDSAEINAAIAALSANQDYIYTALTTGTDISVAQYALINAKKKAVTGLAYQWQVTDRAAGGVSMAYQAWTRLNPKSTPPYAILYMSDLLANLTAAEEQYGADLALSIVARYNDVDNMVLSFNESLLQECANLMDVGIYSDKINAADVANLSVPVQDKLGLSDRQMEGVSVTNYLAVIPYVPRRGVISSETDIAIDTGGSTYVESVSNIAHTLVYEPATTVANLQGALIGDDGSIQTYKVYDGATEKTGATALAPTYVLRVTSQDATGTQDYTMTEAV